AWERLVLPSRVADYRPAYLDELCSAGEVVWAGTGSIPGGDGWLAFSFADSAPLLLPPADTGITAGATHEGVLAALDGGQALFFRQLTDLLAPAEEADVLAALWDLVWAGLVSNDTIAPLRAMLAGSGAHRSRPSPGRSRYRSPGRLPAGRLTRASLVAARSGPPTAVGRWYRLPDRDPNPTRRATALAEALLDRHGVVTRGAVLAEQTPGGFAAVYPVLAALEERGSAWRGYFVEGRGAAQFAVPGAVAECGGAAGGRAGAGRALVLAAADPANPYGAALPWAERVVDDATGADVRSGDAGRGHRAGRKAGALVVLVDGALVLYVER